jgi:dihydroorotate dehydrogenase (NAD+) catalytic subunit
MKYEPFYDPEKSYEENFKDGPFGIFADRKTFSARGGPASGWDFFGYKVNSPFGIPAGPLLNGNFVIAALDKGFDICVYKTVRSEKFSCHPWPNVLSVKIDGDLTLEKAQGKLVADKNYQEPLSITNSFGVPSMDPEFWQKDLAEAVKHAHAGQVVVGSFQGTKREGQSAEDYINDYRITAKLLKDTGVKRSEERRVGKEC